MRPLDALVLDYDRTLTDIHLRPLPSALDALRRARSRGKRIILASGRGLAFLEEEAGDACDVIVAENGCILRGPTGGVLATSVKWDLRACFGPLDVPIEFGDHLASAPVEHASALRGALARAGIQADLVLNRDRVMVLPPGVDKASGVLRALALLGVDPAATAAVGDAENDVPMLLAVGHGIAVANAVEGLKRIADEVTLEEGGHGVAAWIQKHWLAQEVES